MSCCKLSNSSHIVCRVDERPGILTMEHAPSQLEATDRLYVPNRKRFLLNYLTTEEGGRALRIDYGLKEVTFDEVHLFPFAESLVKQASFTGSEATTWGPGYPWEELAPLLEALVEEGIIKRGDGADEQPAGGLVPSPLAPSRCPFARSWSTAECEGITRDIGGRAVEIGHLEAVMPVHRIAHVALDGDDRQVGEANVFPPALRLDRETEWRTCQYAGSRYRDESPMNITALKAMIKHWKAMMVTMLAVREHLWKRLGSPETWSVGDLHTFSSVVLALPAYQLVKGGGHTPQRPLHPVLSSLFRITDGIRMTTYEMLFLLSEKPRHPDDLMTAAELYSYAETHGVFISDTGVCAGPKPLIDEFLAVAVDGTPIEGTEGLVLAPEVQSLLAELPEVIDYGLLGLQVWGICHASWVVMSKAYGDVLAILGRHGLGPLGQRLHKKLHDDWEKLRRVQITEPYDREIHLIAYADAYERARRASRSPLGAATLAEALAPVAEGVLHQRARAELLGHLQAQPASELGGAAALQELTEVLTRYLREEQGILTSATLLLSEINTRLDRPAATRPLTMRDLRVYYVLTGGGFPYLFDALEDVLGFRVECDAHGIMISADSTVARSVG
ncbi:MAG: hypothetical protein R3B48_20970 [Kofleriaceae bacterium]